jgi:hypothetical protein
LAIACAVLAGVVLIGAWANRDDDWLPSVPPGARAQTFDDAVPSEVVDPRSYPAFAEAYDLVCLQTLAGIDALYAAAAVGAPDLMTSIDAQQQTLAQRIDQVASRTDLWDATDPLVLEYAESISEDLTAVIDGTDIGFEYLDGDVVLFRSLCSDWAEPG